MHLEIRLFPGMAGQGGRLAARRSEIEDLLRGMPGLRSFELAETREGVAVVAVADEPAAAAEGHRRFAAWIAKQLPDLERQDAFTVTGAVIARLEA